VLNDEVSIRRLAENVRIPGATITPTKAPRGNTDEVWWNWKTVSEDAQEDAVEEAVLAMLLKYRPFFDAIKEHRGAEADVYLEVVQYFNENERPSGLYLSTESLSLLSELGAALDVDAVPDVHL
jgi:hypothetical protein